MSIDLRARQKALRANPATQLFRHITRPSFIETGGLRLLAPHGRVSRRVVSQIYRGVYETGKRIIAEALTRPGDRVLEAGAGMGLVTVAAAKIAGPDKVVSYEALPHASQIIRENLALNGLRADVRQRAVAARAQTLTFHVNDDIISSSAHASRGARSMDVEADGIADIVAEVKPDVLLMDIEGAEADVVPACPLDGLRAVMVQIHGDIVSDAEASAIMARFIASGLLFRHQVSIGNIWAFSRQD